MTPERWEELLQACLDGTLDEAQEGEFARWLRASPEARRQLRSSLQVEGGLLALARARCLAGEPPASDDSPDDASEERSRIVPMRGTNGNSHAAFDGWRRLAWGLVALAATVLLAAGWGWFRAPSPVDPAVVAHVLEVEGTLEIVTPSGEVRQAQPGYSLRAGDTLRTGDGDSYAVVEDGQKRRLELSSETIVRLADPGSHGVQLTQGVLRGSTTAPAPEPFVVGIKDAEVRVQGDRFVLSSSAAESVRVDVEEGKAQVVRPGEPKGIEVESGGSILIRSEAGDTILERVPYVTEPRRVLGFPGAWAVWFADGGDILAASCRELQRFGPNGEVQKTPISTNKTDGRLAAFTRDGRTLLAFHGPRPDDRFFLWDVTGRKLLRTIDARVAERQFYALAPDASWLATVDKDASKFVLHLWDAATGAERTCVTVPAEAHIDCLTAAPSCQELAAGLVNLGRKEHNSIRLLDPVTGETRGSLPTRAYPLTVMQYSPDGRYLAAGITGQVQLWDVARRELVRTIRGFERVLLSLAFSPDGTLLAGGTQDGQVWLWDVATGEEVQVIQAGASGVRVLAFAPDGRSLITGGIKRQPLMQWDVPRRSQG
ncbi:MAG: FecR domain-containing protein [Planctomycetia bacterium]|nr:FecR domain-containing protein [Planctomycetia bacterium]